MEILKFLNLEISDAVMIPINCFLFYFFYKIYSKNVINKLIKVIDTRESQTVGAIESSKQLIEQARDISSIIKNQLNSVRASAINKKEQIIKEAIIKANILIEKANKESEEYIGTERSKIEKNGIDLMEQLDSKVSQMSQELYNNIV